ncbi:MAG: hypothetical protein KDJ37_00650 [Hyphomicrobiaceae bacterium]|nr:hypothetical protein [Hyphomicrobiaceae bacterium]
MNWDINPLAFLEFFIVLAFGIGWFILEKFANRVGGREDRSRTHDERGDTSSGGSSGGSDHGPTGGAG